MENSSNNTIDLRRLFNLCRKHLKFLITCTIVLALAGFIVSKFIMTPKYTATTQLLVNQKNENNANGQAYTNQQADIQVINTYIDKMQQFRDAIDAGDEDAIRSLIEQANKIKRIIR